MIISFWEYEIPSIRNYWRFCNTVPHWQRANSIWPSGYSEPYSPGEPEFKSHPGHWDWDSICLSGRIEEITTDSTVRFGCTCCHMSPSRKVWAMSAIRSQITDTEIAGGSGFGGKSVTTPGTENTRKRQPFLFPIYRRSSQTYPIDRPQPFMWSNGLILI